MKEHHAWWIVVVLGLLLTFGKLLTSPALPKASDAHVHFRLMHDFLPAAVDKLGYPDWDAHAAEGRGLAMFRFVAPVPLILGAFLQLLGCSALLALKGTVIVFVLIGVFGIRRWFKQAAHPGQNWASLLFLCAPVLSIHLGFVFLLQNICAAMLIPWVMANWEKDRTSMFSSSFSILIYGVMIATHLQTAFQIALLLGVLMLWDSWRLRTMKPFTKLLSLGLGGLMLAGPYVFPLLCTKDETWVSKLSQELQVGDGSWFLDSPFQTADGKELGYFAALGTLWPEALRPAWKEHLHPDHQLHRSSGEPMLSWEVVRPWFFWSTLLWILLAIVSVGITRRKFPLQASGWLGIGAMLMAFSPSEPLWVILPGAAAIQFSWRWVFPGAILLLPWLTSITIVTDKRRHIQWLFLLPIIFSLMIQCSSRTFPIGWEKVILAQAPFGKVFLPITVPKPKSLKFKADMKHRPFVHPGNEWSIQGIGYEHASYHYTYASGSWEFNINTHFDPYWAANGPDGKISLRPDEEGLILGDCPAGPGVLHLFRRAPKGRNLGWVTMLALLSFFMFRLFSKRRSLAALPES